MIDYNTTKRVCCQLSRSFELPLAKVQEEFAHAMKFKDWNAFAGVNSTLNQVPRNPKHKGDPDRPQIISLETAIQLLGDATAVVYEQSNLVYPALGEDDEDYFMRLETDDINEKFAASDNPTVLRKGSFLVLTNKKGEKIELLLLAPVPTHDTVKTNLSVNDIISTKCKVIEAEREDIEKLTNKLFFDILLKRLAEEFKIIDSLRKLDGNLNADANSLLDDLLKNALTEYTPEALCDQLNLSPIKCYTFEWDKEFHGGDFHDTGIISYIPAVLFKTIADPKLIFHWYTKIPAVHLIRYDFDNPVDIDGSDWSEREQEPKDKLFRNYYVCTNCNHEWDQKDDHKSKDMCPHCDANVIPKYSEELNPATDEVISSDEE